MKTFEDYLEYYNNLDVIPFVGCVEKTKLFYQEKKLDIFKDGVSLPGLGIWWNQQMLNFKYLNKKIKIYMI